MRKQSKDAQRLSVAYLRVSSEEQRERHTIENQRDEITRYAERADLVIDRWYEDDGVSGTVPFNERPQGGVLWRDMVAGRVSTVLIYRIDRIARRAIHVLNFVEHVEKHKVQISSVMENIDLTSASGRLMLTIAAAFSENERNVIVERTALGLRRRAREGKVSTRPPYGYVVEDGRFEVEEQKAEIVLKIFRWYAAGVSTKQIVRRLAEAGEPPPRGKKWRHDTLIYMLHQRTYCGEFVYGRKRDPGDQIVINVPAIIPARLFDEVQARITANTKTGPESKSRSYLLRGLIYCGVCGLAYVGHTITGRKYKGRRYPEFNYYECASLTARDYEFCGNARVHTCDLEKVVWSEVESFLRRPSHLIDLLTTRYREQTTDNSATMRQITKVKKLLTKNEESRFRVVDCVADGTFTKELASHKLSELDSARVALLAQLADLEDALTGGDVFQERIKNAEEMLDALSARLDQGIDQHRKAELLRLFVDKIVITTVIDDKGRKRPHASVTYLFTPKNNSFGSDGSGSSASSLKK